MVFIMKPRECKERAHHCPTCSVELSKIESEILNADGCVFHTRKPPRASILYVMAQGFLDAMIYNAKRKKALSGIEELDLKIGYHRALVNAGALEYRNIITLKQKMKLLRGILGIKPIVGGVDE